MPRIRNIKPAFFTDADLGEVSALHRLLFVGLWCHADCRGVGYDKPRELKVQILPYDECDIDSMLWDLADRNFIARYVATGDDGREVDAYFVWEFPTHQRSHKDEKPFPFSGFDGEQKRVRDERRLTGKKTVKPNCFGVSPSLDRSFKLQDLQIEAAQKKDSEPLKDLHTPAQVPAEPAQVVTERPFKSPTGDKGAVSAPTTANTVRVAPAPSQGASGGLLEQLADAFAEAKGGHRPRWGLREANDLRPLVGVYPDDEIVRRARNAFPRKTFPRCAKPIELVTHWDHYAEPEDTGPPTKTKDPTKGRFAAEDADQNKLGVIGVVNDF